MQLIYLALLLTIPGETRASPVEDPVSSHAPSTGLDGKHDPRDSRSGRKLHGRFLHITDFHPDPFYKVHSSTDADVSCHRGVGSAGYYGAETTECDSPYTLINETFKWIDANLKDSIDFVVWTGDSARHDNDAEIPRSEQQVLEQNEYLVEKFVGLFGKDASSTQSTDDMLISIVPNLGNNDVLPHNVFSSGPNRWTKRFSKIWQRFIPEEQRHAFERGGWFYVEVIPDQLAVFSLNTLYFFDSNPESDGCYSPSDAGYEQMEWLRIQLQFIRQRGMKAILIGHVPPARTESKASWEESCWQKYTLWLRQYRDIVVGSVYGHMNIDHFMLLDSQDIDIIGLQNGVSHVESQRTLIDRHYLIQNAADYLVDLREIWSKLPSPQKDPSKKNSKNSERHQQKKYLNEIGGEWAERYMVAHVAPSVVPNYFPSLRIIEYNLTGLEDVKLDARHGSTRGAALGETKINQDVADSWRGQTASLLDRTATRSSRKSGHKKKKKAKGPRLIIPDPPSKSSPPGPAYSPQTFTWLGFTQYYANLTFLNNEPTNSGIMQGSEPGSVRQKKLAEQRPRRFKYEIEYSSFNDNVYKLRDMTVRSYLQLARRIGKYSPEGEDRLDFFTDGGDDVDEGVSIGNAEDDSSSEAIANKKHKKHKKHKGHKRRKKHKGTKNKVWFTFLQRAFVGAKDDEDLHDEYGIPFTAHSREPVEASEMDSSEL